MKTRAEIKIELDEIKNHPLFPRWQRYCDAFFFHENCKDESFIIFCFCGGTGVGKSSMVNQLLGMELSRVSAKRPCTSAPVFIVHQNDRDWIKRTLDSTGLSTYEIACHSKDEFLGRVLVDSPDFDSLSFENHAHSEMVLLLSDGAVFVTSPAKYGDESSVNCFEVFSEKVFLSVLNKKDQVSSGEEELLKEGLYKLYGRDFLFSSTQESSSPIMQSLSSYKPDKKENLSFCKQGLQSTATIISSDLKEEFSTKEKELELLKVDLKEIERNFNDRVERLRTVYFESLRRQLEDVAEQKLFYISKWLTRAIFSVFEKSSLSGKNAVDSPSVLEQQIAESLLLSREQMAFRIEQSLGHSVMIDSDEFLARFQSEFTQFQEEKIRKVREFFGEHIQSKHSVIAVSQEVALSVGMFLILGPLGAIPGWEQLLSFFAFLLYGKMPAKIQPSVMREIERLNKEARQEFTDFLNAYLSEMEAPLISEFQLLENKVKTLKDFESFVPEVS
jgi:GTP-binding protein EngB required for normal cell division